jgi:hypothetical protein
MKTTLTSKFVNGANSKLEILCCPEKVKNITCFQYEFKRAVIMARLKNKFRFLVDIINPEKVLAKKLF